MVVATLLEITKYTIPGIVVLISSYLIVNKFLVNQLQRKQIALIHDTQNETLRYRLQAYERLALFLERMHPRQVIPRVYESGMTVFDLQQAITLTIKTEFDHNLSQQIYVSKQVWETIKMVKEQEINMVNMIARNLDAAGPAKLLHERIIDYIVTTDTDIPSEVALKILHDEAKKVLSYGTV